MSIFFETFFTVRKPWFMSSMNILIDVCLIPRVQYYYWRGCHCCRVDRLHGSHLTLTSRLTTLSEEGLSPGPSLCYYESRQSQSIINSVRSKSHDIYDIRSHDVGHGRCYHCEGWQLTEVVAGVWVTKECCAGCVPPGALGPCCSSSQPRPVSWSPQMEDVRKN